MNITVYLGSTEGRDPALKHAAQELGNWIGESGNSLVYGGSRTGLMGTLEEITEIMSKRSLRQLDAPCILYDLNGYYDGLKKLLEHMIHMGLSSEEKQQGICFAENLEEIKTLLERS